MKVLGQKDQRCVIRTLDCCRRNLRVVSVGAPDQRSIRLSVFCYERTSALVASK
jgi:hypothetical protein